MGLWVIDKIQDCDAADPSDYDLEILAADDDWQLVEGGEYTHVSRYASDLGCKAFHPKDSKRVDGSGDAVCVLDARKVTETALAKAHGWRGEMDVRDFLEVNDLVF